MKLHGLSPFIHGLTCASPTACRLKL